MGDYVYARDQYGEEQAYKEVTEVFVRENSTLIHLVIGGETITTTEEHPFYIEGEGFVEAEELEVGDLAENADGESVPIESVDVEYLEEPIMVYNFEVADYHTYYVGNTEVLVHNTCMVGGNGTKGVSEAGKLKSVGNGVWESTEGLIYGQGSKQGNRVLHVLEHASPDPTKPLHSVFNVSKDKVLGAVDEAWSMRSSVTPTLQKNGNQVFNIPMGRVVGTNGETSIRIVVKNGTSEVVTGFPVK